MNGIKIAIKHKTNLTLQLEKLYDVSYYEKPSLLSKLSFKKSNYPDIYFHKGLVNSEALELVKNSKIVIVNAQAQKDQILANLPEVNQKKIEVLYPYYYSKNIYDKNIKKEFKAKYNIEKKSKIILFRANDLSKNGLGYLFDTISRLYEKNFILIIESNTKQIQQLRTKMEKANLDYPYILLENYENIDELFIASDIFILPTQLKYFVVDIIRAMCYKNAVFLMEQNHASEILDVFSLIQNETDRSTSFKLDSLLLNKDELKNIQKENQIKASEFTLDKSIEKLVEIIKKTFDI